jgi:hypothetical protein
MDLDGYYINLDRSPERRSSMDIQLRDFGLANLVSRFVALDGHSEVIAHWAGFWGCARTLEMSQGMGESPAAHWPE